MEKFVEQTLLYDFYGAVSYTHLELDVQLTKDNQVVVTHDFHLRRNCNVQKEVNQCTYEELQRYPIFFSKERIPLLEDVLKVVDGKVPLIIELKYKDKSDILSLIHI